MAQWLLDCGITSVGTLQSNQKGISAEIKDRETNSYEIYWEKDNGILNLHSYVVKTKSSEKRNVLLLSSCHRFLQLQKMTAKASPLFTNYTTFPKAEQTLLIKKMGFYSCKSKSKRWTMNAFSYILDTCRVNASTIYAMNNDLHPRNIKSVDFGFELAMSLISPHIEQQSLIGINSSVVRKIEIVLGKKISSKHVKMSSGFFPQQREKRRRCDAQD